MKITMDVCYGVHFPKRGDVLRTTKSEYWILSAVEVKRRDSEACRRFRLIALRSSDVSPELQERLLCSADRRNGQTVFDFRWNPRKKKSRSFETLMND